ncbi:hypothetical protein [Candidatus Nephthysia bennettiae]|uniref:Uncharacterized protein n=1 Tax=Candidatus Nephthysia bennettiae TaxID=3127016 RepID=A0A934N946_9BACT|nr:hypothetical protein [Candidatus Dormibacteraeota bacterium]MBJ7614277.1 hypothetical protein [Candidatus Dormibacteraeota bacterium]
MLLAAFLLVVFLALLWLLWQLLKVVAWLAWNGCAALGAAIVWTLCFLFRMLDRLLIGRQGVEVR